MLTFSFTWQLFVTETTKNVTSSYQLLSRKNFTQDHYVTIHWGGRYSVQVRTAVDGAVLSHPVLCNGPQIPSPYELTYNPINGSVSWRNSLALPKEIASRK